MIQSVRGLGVMPWMPAPDERAARALDSHPRPGRSFPFRNGGIIHGKARETFSPLPSRPKWGREQSPNSREKSPRLVTEVFFEPRIARIARIF